MWHDHTIVNCLAGPGLWDVITMHWYSLPATEPPQYSSHQARPGQAGQVVQKSICSRVHLLCSSAQWRQIFWRSNAMICRRALSPEPGPRWGQTGPGNYCNLPTSEYEGQVDRVQPRCDWELRLIKNCPVSPEFPVLSIKGSQWWFGCWDVVDLCESDY